MSMLTNGSKGPHYRLVGMLPVKDEVKNLERWFKRNAEFLDAVVALDDGSTDGSRELLEGQPKVKKLICRPPGTPWYLLKNRQDLLDEARQTGAEWLFFLDADDIMEERFGDLVEGLMQRKDVGRYMFREVTLWRSTRQYRADHADKYNRVDKYPTLVRNRPSLRWIAEDEGWRAFNINLKRRLVSLLRRTEYNPIRKRRYKGLRVTNNIYGHGGQTVGLKDVISLHYHYSDWDHAWRKQIRYALNYAIAHDYKPHEIDSLFEYVTQRLDEEGLRLEPVDPEWGVLD